MNSGINHNLQHIKGIVFDLDDTLYPQESFKRSGFEIVARWVSEQYGFRPSLIVTELEGIMQLRGASYPYMFDDLADKLKMNKSAVSKMVLVFIDHKPIISCYPGVYEMLGRLRKIFKLGLLTDGRLAVQLGKIRALGLETEVDEILCSDMMGLEKPAIELFQWFESRFNLTGTEMMYVGDNPQKDFIGANIRKWTTVMVQTGEQYDDVRESVFKAQFEFSSTLEMENLLDKKAQPAMGNS